MNKEMNKEKKEELVNNYRMICNEITEIEGQDILKRYENLKKLKEEAEKNIRKYVEDTGDPAEILIGDEVLRIARRMKVSYDISTIKEKAPDLYFACTEDKFIISKAQEYPDLNIYATITYNTALTKKNVKEKSSKNNR